MVDGPCSICRELSSFGAMGAPCTPMSCQCICHRKSRIGIQQKTAEKLGIRHDGVVDNHKIVNFIKAGGGMNIRSQKLGYHP